MNHIYLQYLKLKSFILDNTSIRQSVFFGVLSVLLFTVSVLVANRAVEIASGILAGFAFGIFLIKLQAIINYFKGQQVQALINVLMFSNFRYPATLFVLSFLGLTIGLVFKVMHWPGGQMLTGSMIMVQVIAIVWLLILLLKNIKP